MGKIKCLEFIGKDRNNIIIATYYILYCILYFIILDIISEVHKLLLMGLILPLKQRISMHY